MPLRRTQTVLIARPPAGWPSLLLLALRLTAAVAELHAIAVRLAVALFIPASADGGGRFGRADGVSAGAARQQCDENKTREPTHYGLTHRVLQGAVAILSRWRAEFRAWLWDFFHGQPPKPSELQRRNKCFGNAWVAANHLKPELETRPQHGRPMGGTHPRGTLRAFTEARRPPTPRDDHRAFTLLSWAATASETGLPDVRTRKWSWLPEDSAPGVPATLGVGALMW